MRDCGTGDPRWHYVFLLGNGAPDCSASVQIRTTAAICLVAEFVWVKKVAPWK